MNSLRAESQLATEQKRAQNGVSGRIDNPFATELKKHLTSEHKSRQTTMTTSHVDNHFTGEQRREITIEQNGRQNAMTSGQVDNHFATEQHRRQMDDAATSAAA